MVPRRVRDAMHRVARRALRLSTAAVLFAWALGTATRGLDAQVLRVTLADSLSGAPVGAALVAATDAAGAVLVERLSDRSGAATLRLAAPATVRIRVRRIGLVPTLSSAVAVSAGETVRLALRVPRIEQPLPGVSVVADACDPAAQGPRAVALWERLRIALQSSALRWSEPALAATVFERTTRTRELTPALDTVGPAVYERRLGAGRPYTAPDPLEFLLLGFARNADGGSEWYAPDDAVLASEEFRAAHCLTVPPADDTPGIAEVRFVPRPTVRVMWIAGSAFVDTISGDPQRIAFRYVAPPSAMRAPDGGLPVAGGAIVAPHAGGEVGLAKRDDGTWYVARWLIRTPRVERRGLRRSAALAGYREVAGEAIPVDELATRPDTPGPSPLDSIRRRTVQLAVLVGDSFDVAPIDGATIDWVRDGAIDTTRAVTDSLGRATLVLPVMAATRLHVRHRIFAPRELPVVTASGDSALVVRMTPADAPAYAGWRCRIEAAALQQERARAAGVALDPAKAREARERACNRPRVPYRTGRTG